MPRTYNTVTCEYCSKPLSKKNLKQHQLSSNCTGPESGRRITCEVCGEGRTRGTDGSYAKVCRGTGKTPVAMRPVDLKDYNWRDLCPSEIPNLTTLDQVTDDTKALWHRLPRLLPIAEMLPDTTGFVIVARELHKGRFHIASSGTYREYSKQQQREKIDDAFKTLQVCTNPTPPTKASKTQPPQHAVINVFSDMDIGNPYYIPTETTLCGEVSDCSFNVTPAGSFVDLHHDLARCGYSFGTGLCEKVWLLFSPTTKNFEIFSAQISNTNRLRRCGHLLEGGVTVVTESSHGLDIPTGTLHSVFTTFSGVIGGLNYTVMEDLPVMSDLLICELPYYKVSSTAINDDILMFLRGILSATKIQHPHAALVKALSRYNNFLTSAARYKVKLPSSITKKKNQVLNWYTETGSVYLYRVRSRKPYSGLPRYPALMADLRYAPLLEG
ncbi:hypothetical protein BJ875DRAFT_476802 [Amylocarpus encephaloides]|uniref:Uncharacterized protein n=1 Tax=Amylocarpus encephaloides TaxID=45428 RepID=A0A9P7Y8A4_9HELO|nr:hypothetical protein BJ875DRAFT_476802 [Amylocarpus encephaloides]